MIRWFAKFFEVNGVPAMRNATIFITIIISSLIVIYLTIKCEIGWEVFTAYLCAGGGVYSFGKWSDDRTKRSQIEADAAPDISTTTVNQPDVVNVAGDIKTKGKKK